MRTQRRHRKEDHFELPGNGWLVTFNDMMTLLLVFFVLLFSMGDIDGPMVKHFQKSLQSGLGLLLQGRPIADQENKEAFNIKKSMADHPKRENDIVKDPSPQALAARMVERINAQEGAQRLKIGKKGQILMDNSILFPFGKADLNPGAVTLLSRLAEELRTVSNGIRVEGHTDNVPIRTSHYPSNWELSTARAVNVVKYFAGPGRIAPRRLMAAGYADAKPLLPNTSPQNRAGNRRVEIVLLKGKIQ